MDEKTSQKATTRMRTRTQSSCWSFHYCCCCCCCSSSCCYCWSFFLGFGFVLWESSQTFFNWFLIFRDSQTKALNTNSVWDLIRNCRWQIPKWDTLWRRRGTILASTLSSLLVVCLNIIETRFQWVNFEVCPATLWRKQRATGNVNTIRCQSDASRWPRGPDEMTECGVNKQRRAEREDPSVKSSMSIVTGPHAPAISSLSPLPLKVFAALSVHNLT